MKDHTVFNRFFSAFTIFAFVGAVVFAPIIAPKVQANTQEDLQTMDFGQFTSGFNTWSDMAGIAGACAVGPATTGIVIPAISWMTGAIGDLFSYANLTSSSNIPVDIEKTAVLAAETSAITTLPTAALTLAGVAGGVSLGGGAVSAAASVPTADWTSQAQRAAQMTAQAEYMTHTALMDSAKMAEIQAKSPKEAEMKSGYGFLDCLVYTAGQQMLNQLTNNIVRWIQGGFDGAPSYTLNTHEVFLELADMVAGDFARELRGLALCDFRVNFKNDLANTVELSSKRQYKFAGNAKCPFPETFEINSSDFYRGVNKWSWGAMEYAMQESGNPFGVAMLTGEELAARSSENKDVRKQELSWSNGFTNMVDTANCTYPTVIVRSITGQEGTTLTDGDWAQAVTDETVTKAEVREYQKKYCKTTTPGKQVGDLLSKTTGVDMDRLGMVDNINKIVAALIDQVTKKAAMGIFCAVGGNPDEPGCGSNPLPTEYVTTQEKTAETIAMENAALKPYFDAWQAEITKKRDAERELARLQTELQAAQTNYENTGTLLSVVTDLQLKIEEQQVIITAAPERIATAEAAYDDASLPARSIARQQELQAAQAEVDAATEDVKSAQTASLSAEKAYYAALLTEPDASILAGVKQAMLDAQETLAQKKSILQSANARLYAAQHPAYVAPTQ